MIDLKKFSTERRNPKTMSLDTMTPLEIVSIMNQEDSNVITAVNSQLENLGRQIVSIVVVALFIWVRVPVVDWGLWMRLSVHQPLVLILIPLLG